MKERDKEGRGKGCKGNGDEEGTIVTELMQRESTWGTIAVAADAAVGAGASREAAEWYLPILMRYKQPPSMRYNPIADGIRRVALFNETVLR